MFSVSPPSPPTASDGQAGSPLGRRLSAEWDLLQRMAACNPLRLADLRADDLVFHLRLLQTPGLAVERESGKGAATVHTEHEVSLVFPRFFPAVPLEMYLSRPVQHPNIHLETGFVCLWDRHRVSHTTEHAVHKLAAMLGWRLWNREAAHVMQPEALARIEQPQAAVAWSLAAPLLVGVTPDLGPSTAPAAGKRVARRRLL